MARILADGHHRRAAPTLHLLARLQLGQTNFWGFTALYYVMLLECELKYDASALEGKFRPIIPEELGIKYEA